MELHEVKRIVADELERMGLEYDTKDGFEVFAVTSGSLGIPRKPTYALYSNRIGEFVPKDHDDYSQDLSRENITEDDVRTWVRELIRKNSWVLAE